MAHDGPARTNRFLGALFVAVVILFMLARVVQLDDFAYVLASASLITVLGAVIAAPAIWLGVLAVWHPTRIGHDLRMTGRMSALVLGVEGGWLITEALESGATWQLALALVMVAFGVWVFTRSWMLPPEAREQKRSFSAYRLLFVLAVLVVVTATFLIRPFAHSYDKARVTAMKADLRNLHHEQEAFRDSVRRFARFEELGALHRTSAGVHLAMTADSASWRAIASHDLVTAECTAWAGRRPPEARFAGEEGEPYCREP